MKKTFLIFFTFLAIFILGSCQKQKSRLPVITTSSVTPSFTSSQCSGIVYLEGDDKVTEKGLCWGTNSEITVNDNKLICGEGGGSFSANITGLEANKNYNVRAYAINKFGISYGKPVAFKTVPLKLPQLSIGQAYYVTTNSAFFDIAISATYTNEIYTTGVCWSTSIFPTIQNSILTYTPGTLNYSAALTGLGGGITYYVRAFTSNSLGTVYSNQVTFTTNAPLKILSFYSVGLNDASCDIEVLDANPGQITSLGVCWSTNQMPTIADNKTMQTFSALIFSDYLTGLVPNTTYYVRAYLINNSGVYYSPQSTVRTFKGTVTDIDGNLYYTVQIGAQEWMTSNLKVSRFNDGTAIQYVTNVSDWGFYSSYFYRIYSYYGDNASNNSTYGKLYNYYAVIDSKKLAPAGWRVPSEADWNILLANEYAPALCSNDVTWIDGVGGTNLSGFSAQPGGSRNYGGAFDGLLGYSASFWSSTAYDTYYSKFVDMNNYNANWDKSYRESGLSVRCIKN